ncbi:MAG: hemolysin III family protein, partial [Deltaproteobacteria bacterium]|nr:hemolysin III family protein [Deltaproteobacteria bacterium]
ILRILDHVSMYLLIAGSYTPMTMLVLDSFWGTILLVLAWSMAVLGIVYEVFFLGRNKALGVSLYLLMGWVAVFAIKPIYEAVNFDVLLWLFLGGASYSIGVIFYMWKKMPFGHAVWHLFVLFGSASHFICFYKIGDFGWL